MKPRDAVIVAVLALAAAFPAGAQDAPPPKTMQWLHGSSEAAALQRLTFQALTRYAIDAQLSRAWKQPVESAVLAGDATLDAPAWRPCRDEQPGAVIFDIDETVLLNSGWNYDTARRGDPPFDPQLWGEWEKTGGGAVEPMPGARVAIDALRAAGIQIVFISNRDRDLGSENIAGKTAEALRDAGLGEAVPGETLLLKGDIAPGSGKDSRRAFVAGTHCVLAMMGDQFGDFSDAFNPPPRADTGKPDVRTRRELADSAAVAARLGKGWFLLPNPVYGPGVAGDYDDLFPPNTHWPKAPAEGSN